jgi:hypothetical protein
VRHLGIPMADGTNRAPATPAEREFAQALHMAGVRRPVLGRAVEKERLAREACLQQLRRLGPLHPLVNEALQEWRTACAERRVADKQLDVATRRLEAAIEGWASEAAQAWSAA